MGRIPRRTVALSHRPMTKAPDQMRVEHRNIRLLISHETGIAFTFSERRSSRQLRKSLEDGLCDSLRAGRVLTGNNISIDDNEDAPSGTTLVRAQFGQLHRHRRAQTKPSIIRNPKGRTSLTLSSSLNGTYFVFLTASSSSLENPVSLRPA